MYERQVFIMFKAFKISGVIWVMTAIVLTIAAAVLLFKTNTAEPIRTNADSPNLTVVIDPGHGGQDGGASCGDVLEKDLNLSVSLKLRDIITSNGGAAVMTRDGDAPDVPGTNGKFVKRDDLRYRLDVLDKADADLFISIHMNKFSEPKYSGAQVFYSQNGEESKVLGELIQKSLRENLDTENSREAKRNESGIYILKNAKVPAALVECGFLSNPAELEKLKTEEYQQSLAEAIYKGIEEFMEQNQGQQNE